MGLLITVIILTIVVFIATSLNWGYLFAETSKWRDDNGEFTSEKEKLKNKGAKSFRLCKLTLLTLIVPLFLIFGVITTVNANEVGIEFNPLKGGLQDETFDEGMNVKSIFSKVIKISTKTQTFDSGCIYTSDQPNCKSRLTIQTGQDEQGNGGQYVTYQVVLNYKIEKQNAGKFYKEFGRTDVGQEFLLGRIKDSLQSVSTKHHVFDILKGRLNDIRVEVESDLQTVLGNYNITLMDFSIVDVYAGSEIEQIVRDEAIKAKEAEIKLKEQEALDIQLEMELAQEVNDAQRAIEVAKGQLEADKLNAEALALLNSVTLTAIESMYLAQFAEPQDQLDFEAGDTTAYLSRAEVANIVISQLYYDNWDGKLPEVVSDLDGLIVGIGDSTTNVNVENPPVGE